MHRSASGLPIAGSAEERSGVRLDCLTLWKALRDGLSAPGNLGAELRIYISSTMCDLREHRARVIETVRRMGHTAVAMEDYGANDERPVTRCLADVASCDVYVGLLAWRYGYVDGDYPGSMGRSITELEYREADRLGKPCLIFLLGEDAPWLPKFIDQGEAGERVRQLREELARRRLVDMFSSPHELAAKVASMVARLLPDEPPVPPDPCHVERIVGPLPGRVEHFLDREAPIAQLRDHLSEHRLRFIMVCGRAGTGKSALVTQLLHEAACGPPGPGTHAEEPSVVYLALSQPEYRSPDRIAELLCRALPHDDGQLLRAKWQAPGSLPGKLEFMFHRILQGRRFLIVLDGLEAVLDGDGIVTDANQDLGAFIECALDLEHDAALLATSRRPLVLPPGLAGRRGATCGEVSLDGGLPDDEAVALLRLLDADGRLGMRDASDGDLLGVVRPCRSVPRILETVVGTLRGRRTWTLARLLADPSLLAQLSEQPAQQLYESRPGPEREVIEALAVLARGVRLEAVEAVLPGLSVDPLLDSLVRDYVVSFHDGRLEYSLLPPDQQFVYGTLARRRDGKREILHQRAAEYWQGQSGLAGAAPLGLDDPIHQAAHHAHQGYRDTRAAPLLMESARRYWAQYASRETIRACQHVGDVLAPNPLESGHVAYRTEALLLAAQAHQVLGDLDQAAATLVDAGALAPESGDEALIARVATSAATLSWMMGNLEEACEQFRAAQASWQRIGDATRVAHTLVGKGLCAQESGDDAGALALFLQAAEADGTEAWVRAAALNNAGMLLLREGRHEEAAELITRSLAANEESEDRRGIAHSSCSLGEVLFHMGQHEAALSHLTRAAALGREIGDRGCLILACAYLARAQVARGDVASAREALEGLEVGDCGDEVDLIEALRQARAETGIGRPPGGTDSPAL